MIRTPTSQSPHECHTFSKILEKLTKIHAKDSDPYPLIRPVEGRKLSHNLPLFLSGLVARANDKVLYEMHLLSLLVEFLFEMSRSKYRPFRHTSTLAGAVSSISSFIDPCRCRYL